MIKTKYSAFKLIALVAFIAAAPLAYALANQPQQAYHGVGVLKSASAIVTVGENITYYVKVYNPSNFDLYNINVTDPLLGFSDTIPLIAKGNDTGVTFVLNRTALASDPSLLVNTVFVKAIDSEGVYSTASTQAKTTIERLIDVEKTGPVFAHRGEAIKYTIIVKNLAARPFWNVTVKDELIGFSWRGDLSVGESNEFNLTYVVPLNTADPMVNKVVVELNESIYDEDTWNIDILNPRLKVEKTVKPNAIYSGENVTYIINVTNVGDTELFNLTLTDSIYGSAPSGVIPLSLLPGEFFTWSFNATMSKHTINVANATGVDVTGVIVFAQDSACVKIKPRFCPKSMGYWKNHPEMWPVAVIKLGSVNYSKEEAINILKGANAKDATRMLAVQLIAAKLNRLMGAYTDFCYRGQLMNINEVISEADNFLTNHPIGSDPRGEQRELALKLKDALDAYNNRECD